MIGLATPLAAMAVVGVMAVAASVHLGNGFWEQSGGFEYALFLMLSALVPLWAGPGRWSVDRLLGIGGPQPGAGP
jgi:putative oxidoreductase